MSRTAFTAGARQAAPPPAAVVARVVRSDNTGVYAVPVGGDERTPLGPCAAATELALVGGSTAPALVRVRLPVGRRVLLVQPRTDGEPPWVLAHDP